MQVHAHILQMLPQVAPWSVFRAIQRASKAFQQSPSAMFTARQRFRTLTRVIDSSYAQFWYELPNTVGDGVFCNVVDSRVTYTMYYIRNRYHGVHVRYKHCGDTVRVKCVNAYLNGIYMYNTRYYTDGSMLSHTHRTRECEYEYELFKGPDGYGCGEFVVRVKRAGAMSMYMVRPQDDKLRLECCGRDVRAVVGEAR